jgi:hypothetical protein
MNFFACVYSFGQDKYVGVVAANNEQDARQIITAGSDVYQIESIQQLKLHEGMLFVHPLNSDAPIESCYKR